MIKVVMILVAVMVIGCMAMTMASADGHGEWHHHGGGWWPPQPPVVIAIPLPPPPPPPPPVGGIVISTPYRPVFIPFN